MKLSEAIQKSGMPKVVFAKKYGLTRQRLNDMLNEGKWHVFDGNIHRISYKPKEKGQ